MHYLTIECNTKVFKTLASSKIVFLLLISKVLTKIISELKRIQKLSCGFLNQK